MKLRALLFDAFLVYKRQPALKKLGWIMSAIILTVLLLITVTLVVVFVSLKYINQDEIVNIGMIRLVGVFISPLFFGIFTTPLFASVAIYGTAYINQSDEPLGLKTLLKRAKKRWFAALAVSVFSAGIMVAIWVGLGASVFISGGYGLPALISTVIFQIIAGLFANHWLVITLVDGVSIWHALKTLFAVVKKYMGRYLLAELVFFAMHLIVSIMTMLLLKLPMTLVSHENGLSEALGMALIELFILCINQFVFIHTIITRTRIYLATREAIELARVPGVFHDDFDDVLP